MQFSVKQAQYYRLEIMHVGVGYRLFSRVPPEVQEAAVTAALGELSDEARQRVLNAAAKPTDEQPQARGGDGRAQLARANRRADRAEAVIEAVRSLVANYDAIGDDP